VVADVDQVLGSPLGQRIGEAPDRYGQYYRYLTIWMFALVVLGRHRPGHRARAVKLVRQVPLRFWAPAWRIHWNMFEDLSAPEPGFGLGALDPFQALAVYRVLEGVPAIWAWSFPKSSHWWSRRGAMS
jgi:hypothetical protein